MSINDRQIIAEDHAAEIQSPEGQLEEALDEVDELATALGKMESERDSCLIHIGELTAENEALQERVKEVEKSRLRIFDKTGEILLFTVKTLRSLADLMIWKNLLLPYH